MFLKLTSNAETLVVMVLVLLSFDSNRSSTSQKFLREKCLSPGKCPPPFLSFAFYTAYSVIISLCDTISPLCNTKKLPHFVITFPRFIVTSKLAHVLIRAASLSNKIYMKSIDRKFACQNILWRHRFGASLKTRSKL